MKKVIFGFVATIMFSVNGFSNTPVIENEMKFENEKSIKSILCGCFLREISS